MAADLPTARLASPMMEHALFSPLKLRELTLANRIVVPPMGQGSAVDGRATDWHFVHYGQFAAGGAGLALVEATCVDPAGRFGSGSLGLYNDEQERSLKRIVEYYREFGNVPIGIQLAHGGRKAARHREWDTEASTRSEFDAWPVIGPSPIPYGTGWLTPVEATHGDLDALLNAFVAAVGRSHRIGFDVVEVHAAHGYLLHQFLSPVSNRRADEYGGSFENRIRFPLEVIGAMRRAWPAERPMGVRVSATDWLVDADSWRLEDTVAFARRLKAIGIDYVCCSSGGSSPAQQVAVGPRYQVPFAASVRSEAGIATMAVGSIYEPADAAAIVADGLADLVALARGMLYDPHWPLHAAQALGVQVPYALQYMRAEPKRWLKNTRSPGT